MFPRFPRETFPLLDNDSSLASSKHATGGPPLGAVVEPQTPAEPPKKSLRIIHVKPVRRVVAPEFKPLLGPGWQRLERQRREPAYRFYLSKLRSPSKVCSPSLPAAPKKSAVPCNASALLLSPTKTTPARRLAAGTGEWRTPSKVCVNVPSPSLDDTLDQLPAVPMIPVVDDLFPLPDDDDDDDDSTASIEDTAGAPPDNGNGLGSYYTQVWSDKQQDFVRVRRSCRLRRS